jgi:hypothetical protein
VSVSVNDAGHLHIFACHCSNGHDHHGEGSDADGEYATSSIQMYRLSR